MATFIYLSLWSVLIKRSLTFSLEMLLREEEGLFRFSADGTQKRGKKKKKAPTLHSRNSRDIFFSSSKTKYVLCNSVLAASL